MGGVGCAQRAEEVGKLSRRVNVSGRATSGIVILFLLGGLLTASPANAAAPKCFGRTATIRGTSGDDVLRGTNRRDVIVARGGNDTIRARGGNDLVCAGGGGFDVVFAGGGNDRIRGGRGFDLIFPAGGNDVTDGGSGFDLVTYEGSTAAVRVNLDRGTARGQGRDQLLRIEGAAGSEAGDRLVGTDANNDLLGYGGDDTIVGGEGDDFLSSGAGNDDVDGGAGSDFLDLVFSNAGPRLGDDTLTDAGASVDLAAGTVTGPEGVGDDVLTSIESVAGTLGNDTLTGSDDFNVIVGFEGDDTISMGGPGEPDFLGVQDVAAPGPGDDTVIGSSGTDAVDYDFLSPVAEPTAGASIDLQAGTASGADIGTDELTSFEAAVGTIFEDTLSGTAQANTLIGLEGGDSIDGRAGDDVLDGDAFLFGAGEEFDGVDVLTGGPGTDTCVGGSAGDTECESTEPPAQASTLRAFGADRQLARGTSVRYLLLR